jgi:hypothetical protein
MPRMRRSWTTLGVTTVVALLAGAAPAAAKPGDPPVVAVFPDNGTAVPIDPEGVEVRYACPEPYLISGNGDAFSVFGGRDDYGVDFASAPDLGNNGRLLDPNVFDRAGNDPIQDNDIPIGQCRGWHTNEVVPRIVYWQAWRLCLDCPGSYETSEVRSFRLTTSGSALRVAAKWPRRAYAGYPFHVAVTSSGIAAGTAVELQARSGAGWRRFGRVNLGADAGDGPALLARGRHRVRAVVGVGGEEVASAAKTLNVRRAKGWKTSGRHDGVWRDRGIVQFRVGGGGRLISDGRFQLSLLCPTPGMVSPFTTMIADAPLSRARIAPDGSFAWAGVIEDHVTYVHGTIRGNRASGRARLSLGTCTGGGAWKARRG